MKVHFIAIGGSAMHNLALALHQKGYEITGSDDAIFEPSRGKLQKAGLLPDAMGWFPDKITGALDFVILGMHAKPDNPELARAQELDLEILSYPEFIYRQCESKTRVVIAGSHGKTTITAMILHVLHYHHRDTDYMVGAQLAGFDNMVKLTDENEFIVLEGDEYLSSPLDERPKFLHYHPNIALLSGIAWDHINVFPTYELYLSQFDQFIGHIEAGGALIYNESDPEVKELVENHPHQVKKFPYAVPNYEVADGEVWLETPEEAVPLKIFGQHNLNNLEGARWICNQMGVTDDEFYEAIAEFSGASRRLEEIRESDKAVLYRDFAHAPSKVKASVDAVRETHPNKKLVVFLELHTYSSLNREFLAGYRGTLNQADEALVYFDPEVVKLKRLESIDKEDLRKAFQHPGLTVANTKEEILEFGNHKAWDDTAVLVMSSGNFTGIDWLEFPRL